MLTQNKKFLVCITPQTNSKRLIDKAIEESKGQKVEIHLLHVEKGNNIFLREDSAEMLQKLFSYASELGCIIHGLCGDDISETIIKFVKDEKITNVVIGERAKKFSFDSVDVWKKLRTVLPYIEITVLERD